MMNQPDFSALFARQANLYAQFRPTYPDEWFTYLAGLAPGRQRALDCATGNGQAVPGLAGHFQQVLAIDPSQPQLAHRQNHSRAVYLAARAEALPVRSASVDLIAAAQAAHWFDMQVFAQQARRVLRPGGVVAVWCYENLVIGAAIEAAVRRYYHEIVGPYWSPRRRLLEEHFQTLPFPFEELPVPHFEIRQDWTFENLIGYLISWSAAQDYIQAKGHNPLMLIQDELLAAWGDPATVRTVRWPMYARVGRV